MLGCSPHGCKRCHPNVCRSESCNEILAGTGSVSDRKVLFFGCACSCSETCLASSESVVLALRWCTPSIGLVGGLNPSEKYESVGSTIPKIWKNGKSSKPPTRYTHLSLKLSKATGVISQATGVGLKYEGDPTTMSPRNLRMLFKPSK